MSNEDDSFKHLDDWLGDLEGGLYREVLDLLVARHVFNEVHRIVTANKEIRDTPSTFWSWMNALYPTWASMVIRRLSDNRKNSKSFLRFLREASRRPEVLSRERFVNRYLSNSNFDPSDAITLGNKDFDACVGPKERHLPRSVIEKDMETLLEKTSAVVDFTNRRIAHIDRIPPQSPTFKTLDECIEFFEELLGKYVILFRAVSGTILPVIEYDWLAIFRTAWIPQFRERVKGPLAPLADILSPSRLAGF
jgi:hypothetical protein